MKSYTLKQRIGGLLFGLLMGAIPAVAQTLYVGANYHPHDDPRTEKIEQDIRLMKEAGLNVVRMGHLAWDSYEPEEGVFRFEWFDGVMDRMAEAGIRVLLDIAVRPAPLWLHGLSPYVDVTDASGSRLYPNHRYMDDVGDPVYQRYALRFARRMAERYARHPALLAFGLDNEAGDGLLSYSEGVRQRFIGWLQQRYGSLEALNTAWATQRWSRRLGSFEEVGLPQSAATQGAPERMLDYRRFVSDELVDFYSRLADTVRAVAPDIPLHTNAWYFSDKKMFDYAPLAYSGWRPGCGFYPGGSLTAPWGIMDSLFGMTRIRYESTDPFWCNEFTTMTAAPGSIRRSAYATLLYGNQMVCGWTWQSMHAGEEQYLQGLIDWDGTPNRKYGEYRRIAREFRLLAPYFPYRLRPEVALAYSFPSQMASVSFPQTHQQQMQAAFDLFYHRNMDVHVVDLARSPLAYRLLLLPGLALIDSLQAERIRQFVAEGGTAVMTLHSAVVDTTGQVFRTPQPGLLTDVFGIRVSAYEELGELNDISLSATTGRQLRVTWEGDTLTVEAPQLAVVRTEGAEVMAAAPDYTGSPYGYPDPYPVVTQHRYGKGRAIYVGVQAGSEMLARVVDRVIREEALRGGPDVPPGVLAREVDAHHALYLNMTGEPQTIPLPHRHGKAFLRDAAYRDSLLLPPYEPEFIEW